MKTVQVSDDGGDIMTLTEHNGYIFPVFPDTRTIEGLSSVKIRDDDILLSTYPRSGTHWVYEILRELVTGKITSDATTMKSTLMEFTPEDNYAHLSPPRILSSHTLIEQLPPDIINKNIKTIYIIRNPKDVAVSYYNLFKSMRFPNYKGKWENFLQPFCLGKYGYGSWFDHVKKWQEVKLTHPNLPLLTLFYEDLKQDQAREMRKLCQFLGVDRSDDFLSHVCFNTELLNMRAQKGSRDVKLFRKGQVADWKNWFTEAQNEWFDQFFQEKMKDCPLKIRFD